MSRLPDFPVAGGCACGAIRYRLNGSPLGHNAAERSLPLRDAFAVLFFVSVGMLFDPSILVKAPLAVAGVIGIVVVGKTLAALVITTVFKLDRKTSLTVAASLAQIGEFSFILAALSMSEGAMRAETRDLILAGALLSISLHPFVFALVDQLLLAVLPLWGEQSIVALYGEGYGPGLLGFAWTLAFNLAIVFLSYALVVLHGRVGKAPVLLGLLAFGLLAFVLVPTVFQVVPGAADAAGAVLLPALGFTAQGIVLANPIVLFAVVAVLSALAAYLLTRRAEVR